MAGARDAQSVIADYLGQFAADPDNGPGPEPAGLIRWLADEGWTLVPSSSSSAGTSSTRPTPPADTPG